VPKLCSGLHTALGMVWMRKGVHVEFCQRGIHGLFTPRSRPSRPGSTGTNLALLPCQGVLHSLNRQARDPERHSLLADHPSGLEGPCTSPALRTAGGAACMRRHVLALGSGMCLTVLCQHMCMFWALGPISEVHQGCGCVIAKLGRPSMALSLTAPPMLWTRLMNCPDAGPDAGPDALTHA